MAKSNIIQQTTDNRAATTKPAHGTGAAGTNRHDIDLLPLRVQAMRELGVADLSRIPETNGN